MAGRKYSLFETSAFLSQRASEKQRENRFKFVQSIEPLRGPQVRNQTRQKISESHSKSSAGHLQPLLLPHVRKTGPLKPSFFFHLSIPFPRRSKCMSLNQEKITNDIFDLYLSHFTNYKGTACSVRQVLESAWLILIP